MTNLFQRSTFSRIKNSLKNLAARALVVCSFLVHEPYRNAIYAQAKLEQNEMQKQIDLLASNNNPPQIVKATGTKAVFGKDFDRDEEKRVVKQIEAICSRAEEFWPILLQSTRNDKYSITLGRGKVAANYTVGMVCKTILIDTLTAVHRSSIPESDLAFRELYIPDVIRGNNALLQWCRDRQEANMPLYEMQVKLCEWVKVKITTLDPMEVTDDEKLKSIRKLDRDVILLQSTQKAVLVKTIINPAWTHLLSDSSE